MTTAALWGVFWLLSIFFLAGEVEAVGLGQMTVLSPLGKRFEAEVQLIDHAATRPLAEECFEVLRPSDTVDDIPVLTRARISVEHGAGKRLLRITSNNTINEPLLRVSLGVGCGGELVRNYVLLIDPPTDKTRRGAPALPSAPATASYSKTSPTATANHRRGGGRQNGKQRSSVRRSPPEGAAFIGAALPAAADRDSAARDSTAAIGKTSVDSPAPDRLLISSGADGEGGAPAVELPLRLSTRLSIPLRHKAGDGERSILRMEYRLLAALHAQAEQQLTVAEQLHRLEVTLVDLQERAGSGPPPPLATAPIPAPPAKPPARDAAEQRQPLSPTPAERARLVDQEPDWWLEMASLLGLIAGLTWLLRRRSDRRSYLPEETAAAAATIDTSDDSGWELQTLSPLVGPDLAGGTAGLADAAPPSDDDDDHPGGVDQPAPAPSTSDSAEVTAVLELAEIMVSFGRIRGAEQALDEFIGAQPLAALTPWLKLLEIYQHNGQRQAFEALGVKLKGHFNVAPADWNAVAALGGPVVSLSDERIAAIDDLLPRLPTVGPLTRIRHEISRTWGTPECRAYMNNLLRDNRNGERQGFSVATVRELLFLIDLLESRIAEAH